MTTPTLGQIGQRTPDRLGQATAVEQSRAIAQVQAQVAVAQQFPRDPQAAIRSMREACAQPQLAERAFWAFPRGREQLTGPSVYLARELARCWGNVEYGVTELRRDDQHGQSEILAFAWDLQTNTRSSAVFIVPHKRDKRGGPEPLTDMRDIYENNANQGARRVREAIFAVLPVWFTEEAKELCTRTLTDGGGKPLAQRVADAVGAFAAIGVRQAQLETRTGSKTTEWTAQDVAQLGVLITSIRRNEISKDEAFPAGQLTAADISTPKTPARAADGNAATPEDAKPSSTAARAGSTSSVNPVSAFARLKSKHKAYEFSDEEWVDIVHWLDPQWPEQPSLKTTSGILDDHLQAAGGDVETARSNVWEQFRQMNPEQPEASDG